MQSKLYRFEIVRSLANGVYEAKDPADGTITFLYEWTPAPGERAPAKQRLDDLGEQLTCEVLTADASLYVAAASRELGRDAVRTLQAHGLFTETRWDDRQPPPPFTLEPADLLPPPEVVPKRPAPPAPRRWGWIVLVMLAIGGIAYGIGHTTGYSFGVHDGTAKEDAYLVPERNRLADENTHLQAELTSQGNSSRGNSEALRSFDGTHLLRIKNDCSRAIRTAVLYTDYSGQPLVKGWTGINPGQTAVLAASPSENFYVYAQTQDGQLSWGSDIAHSFGVAETNFAYSSGESLFTTLRKVDPISLQVNQYGQIDPVSCPGK